MTKYNDHGMLSAAGEHELVRRARSGDLTARDELARRGERRD